MTSGLRALMLAGLGALDFTEEKLATMFDELVHRGELHEKEAKDLVAAWKTRAEERRQALAAQIRNIVKEELNRHELARQEEVDRIAEHLARIERQVMPIEEVPAR